MSSLHPDALFILSLFLSLFEKLLLSHRALFLFGKLIDARGYRISGKGGLAVWAALFRGAFRGQGSLWGNYFLQGQCPLLNPLSPFPWQKREKCITTIIPIRTTRTLAFECPCSSSHSKERVRCLGPRPLPPSPLLILDDDDGGDGVRFAAFSIDLAFRLDFYSYTGSLTDKSGASCSRY